MVVPDFRGVLQRALLGGEVEAARLVPLAAEFGFDSALGFGHGRAELVFGEQLGVAGTGVAGGRGPLDDPVTEPDEFGLVGLVRDIAAAVIGGFGACGAFTGEPPLTAAAEFGLKVGGLAGELVGHGSGALVAAA